MGPPREHRGMVPVSQPASFVFAIALCFAGLSACGGVARGDKTPASAAGGPAVGGGGGANTASELGTSGTANSAGGVAALAQGGTAGAAANQGGGAGVAAEAGSFACGAATCTSTQVCVARQCGGGPVQCMAETDGGCPAGWHAELCLGGQFENKEACVPDPCSPPPPECVEVPAACAGKLDCFCLNQGSVCLGPGCASIVGRQVTCNGAQ